jgi:hypothetical protein
VIFTRIAWVLGLMFVGALCWLAAATGFTPAIAFVVTAFALVALIGGGNLINGRSPPYGGRRGDRDPSEPGGPPGTGSA